jgi:hypothetical protein
MGLVYDPEGDYLPYALRAAGIASRSNRDLIRYLRCIEALPRVAPAWSASTLDNTLTRYGFRPVTEGEVSRRFWNDLRDRARIERRATKEAKSA